ncbi:hypothetical protein [uncultured Clostridium sp.]|uniref:hypothetical protein n=1 Tax=uncultured Clostridium sp. TaxID=59620 RepID=UPI0025FA3C89|nr:hypothetical protein [uncultured Clostridium sp.]
MIEVKYKNTEKQICDFSMHRAASSESYKKALKKKSYVMSAMFCVAALIYVFVGFKMKDQGKLPMGLFFAGGFFICSLINLFLFEKYADRHVRKTISKTLHQKGNIIDSNIRVKYDGKMIKVIRNKEKSSIKLDSVIEIIQLNECLCIAAKGDPGIAIPFDAFKTKDDMYNLESSLNKYIRQV